MKKTGVLVSAVFGIGFGYHICRYLYLREALQNERKQTQKLDQLLRTANRMIIAGADGKWIHRSLEEKKIATVAIYGMSEMGERIMEDILLHSSVRLLYGIDRRAEEMKLAIPVYTLEAAAGLEKPEAVILTAFSENDSLKKEIEQTMGCQVITIGELLYE